MVVSALRTIGIDTTVFKFSGVCCRMGGLAVATEAGVPENILWMQSGRATLRTGRPADKHSPRPPLRLLAPRP